MFSFRPTAGRPPLAPASLLHRQNQSMVSKTFLTLSSEFRPMQRMQNSFSKVTWQLPSLGFERKQSTLFYRLRKNFYVLVLFFLFSIGIYLGTITEFHNNRNPQTFTPKPNNSRMILDFLTLQCNYYNQGYFDKVDQSHYRKITIHSQKVSCQS